MPWNATMTAPPRPDGDACPSRQAVKRAQRAEDERQLQAGEVTAAELSARNGLFGSLRIVGVRIIQRRLKVACEE